MYSGNEHDGQYWAQNNVYSLKHIVPTLLQWWKFHRNNVNEGDTITSTEFAENVSKGTDFLPPASVRHFLDTSLDLGLLKRDNSNYVITAKGIRFMEMNFPQRWIDEKWQGDIQNLINDANGGCFSSVKNEPLLEWTEDQKDFLCSELLDACFDADTKFLIFKELRFIRFNGGRWMPASGNASSSVWSNDHLRKGLFRLFFRKIFNKICETFVNRTIFINIIILNIRQIIICKFTLII